MRGRNAPERNSQSVTAAGKAQRDNCRDNNSRQAEACHCIEANRSVTRVVGTGDR